MTAKAAKAAKAAEALVAQMEARERLGADVGVGITGVAGPAEQEGKPAGTVHIAVASADRVSETSQHFHGGRSEIKWRAAITALNLPRLHLMNMRR